MTAPVEHPPVYDELLDLLADKESAHRILHFHASPATQARVDYLLAKNRRGTLTDAESRELDELERLEHLVRMLKARVRQKLVS